MGENGAGKSTLGKILAGIHRPDEGRLLVDGVERRFHSPLDAQRAGVAIVHQELSFCPNLSVAENICLSHLPGRAGRLDWPQLHERARFYLDQVGAECDAHEELGRLSTGQTQLVQIAAALATGAKILVMDEPTSSLSAVEAQRLEELVVRLCRQGTTILYVSHRMDEIFRLCDVVTVMRDGRHVTTQPLAQTNEAELVRQMIGRSWEKCFRFMSKGRPDRSGCGWKDSLRRVSFTTSIFRSAPARCSAWPDWLVPGAVKWHWACLAWIPRFRGKFTWTETPPAPALRATR
jgi:ABC-type sugar transport system ATPase subunit